jgi:microsomal dipeptidase-like Zn-dependent dipeptidase
LRTLPVTYPIFFGGGCLDPTTPLSRAGRFIVGQMREIGILVDCSHSSEQTTLDIISMATRPVVCSHSNAVALNDNPRNLSNRVIRGIADTGGLIGVNPLNAFLVWSRKDGASSSRADTGPFPPCGEHFEICRCNGLHQASCGNRLYRHWYRLHQRAPRF